MGNRILGVLLLALAVVGVVVTGDRVHSRRAVVVTAGPGEATSGVTGTTVAPAATEVAAPTGAAPAPGAAPATTTTATTASATTASAPAPTDQALAQQMVLRKEDLPAGFDQQQSGTSRSSAGGGEDAFDSCLGPDTATLRRALAVRARSPNFARRPASVVSSAAALFDTPASASRVLAALRSEAARDCLEKRANDRLADDPGFPEGSSGTMTRITLGAFGEEARAYRLEVRMPPSGPSGKDATYLADFLFVRKGRAVVMVQFGSLDQPFPLAEAQAIAGRLAARM